MRGLVFTVDAILALSVIAAALLIANAFSNTTDYNTLSMHISTRDYLDLKSKDITIPPEKLTFQVTENKDEITGGLIVSRATKQYYVTCSCETSECDLTADSACLEQQGEVKTLEAWSAK